MSRPKKGADPEKVYLNESQRLQQRNKCQIGIRFPPDIVERLRNLVWATQIEGGINGIVEQATLRALEKLEAEYLRVNNKPVPTRPGAADKIR